MVFASFFCLPRSFCRPTAPMMKRTTPIKEVRTALLEYTGVDTFGNRPWMENCLVVSNMNFIFHFIYGMSSFPLTNSIIFQDGYCTTNEKMMVKSVKYGECRWMGTILRGFPSLFPVYRRIRGLKQQNKWQFFFFFQGNCFGDSQVSSHEVQVNDNHSWGSMGHFSLLYLSMSRPNTYIQYTLW